MEAGQSRDHQWDEFVEVEQERVFELEKGQKVEIPTFMAKYIDVEAGGFKSRFISWGRNSEEADKTSFIHWIRILDDGHVPTPWGTHGD